MTMGTQRNGTLARVIARGAILAVLAAGLLAALLGAASAGAAELPEKDPFYQPPAGFEADAPGTVLKSREVTIPEASNDKVYQLLFRSSSTFDEPIVAVTTVIVPKSPWTGLSQRPLASYQEPIDSLGAHCNPSYELQEGTEYEDQWSGLLSRGWAVNIPDFEGEDMEFAAGKIAAHIVLDSIRAVYNFKAAGLSPSNPLGLIGYSGGGQATTWALEQQPSYAPELHIVAGAPGGIPVDLKEVGEYNNGGIGFGLVLAASIGVERAYPELELNSILNAEGLAAEKKIENQCLTEYVENYPFKKFSEYTKPEYPEPLDIPKVEKVLVADSLAKAAPAEPVFLWQSKTDELVPAAGVERLANYYCSEGVDVTFDLGASGEHISYDVDNFPVAAVYLEERFNGESVPSTCGVNASENTTIESGPSGLTNHDSATFTYSAEPEVAGTSFECKLDGAEFESCPASGMTYPALSTGQHTFAARSVSATGEKDVSPATRSFTYVPLSLEGQPEFGRCVKAAKKKGEYKSVHCNLHVAGSKGAYDWLPGPGAKKSFASVMKAIAIESTGASKALITCTAATAEGEYTGVHTEALKKLTFTGCAQSPSSGVGSECQDIGASNGEIEAKELHGELAYVARVLNPAKEDAKVGIVLNPASGTELASFECGGANETTGRGTGTGTLRELEGSVIGRVDTLENMVATNTTSYEVKNGVQDPELFEGGLPDTLVTRVGLTKAVEPTTFAASEEVKNEEPMEVRAKTCSTKKVCGPVA